MKNKCKAGFEIGPDKCRRCGATAGDRCAVAAVEEGKAYTAMLVALHEAHEYFAVRSEGEYFTDRAAPVGNLESRLAADIREVIDHAERWK